jgi:hypothetical protein
MQSFKQFLLNEAPLSPATQNETKALLAQMAKMDADKAARQNKVNPSTGRSYMDTANQATQASLDRERSRENFDELAKTMPNQAARARFNTQSAARSAAPGGMNANSDMASFGALSQEDQNRVASTQSTARLQSMRQAQYSTSSQNVAQGRAGQAMGGNRASGINAINAELEDRRTNAMGGKDAAASYARTWQEDPTSLRTQQSMAVRTPRERLAMMDAMKEEGLRQIREKGKLDPKHVEMVNQFGKSAPKETETSAAFGRASREPIGGSKPAPTTTTASQSSSTAPAPQSSSTTPAPKKTYAEIKREQQARMTQSALRGGSRFA